MDVLANVLDVGRIANAVLGYSELLAPWGLEVGTRTKAAAHLLQRGCCWLKLAGSSNAIQLGPGDVVLVGRGTHHALLDEVNSPALPYREGLERMRLRLARERKAAAPPAARLCAEYEFPQDSVHPFFACLPRLIHIRADAAQANAPLQALVRVLLLESQQLRSGADIVIPRLVDTLLIYILRAWLDAGGADPNSWFAALSDPQIGQALEKIHRSPARNWTVEELARGASQSRATFARRFTRLVGEPPLSYLGRWRMNLAAKSLCDTDQTLERIALRLGYGSAVSFGKAFKKFSGKSPRRYRLSNRGQPES